LSEILSWQTLGDESAESFGQFGDTRVVGALDFSDYGR
jgi:hypothetical protein